MAGPVSFKRWQDVGPTKHSVAQKTECNNGHKHDSKREAARCDLLHARQKMGLISHLRSQPFYPFHINGETLKMANGHMGGVTLDFDYHEDGKIVAEDIKPRSKAADSRDWSLRKAVFKHIYRSIELREVRK